MELLGLSFDIESNLAQISHCANLIIFVLFGECQKLIFGSNKICLDWTETDETFTLECTQGEMNNSTKKIASC